MIRIALVVIVLLISLNEPVGARADAPDRVSAADSTYEVLASAVLRDYFGRHPTHATDLGLHEFDDRLEDYSRTAVAADLASMKDFRRRLAAVDPAALDQDNRLDRDFLLHVLEGEILRAESVRAWEKDPDIYSSGITNSAYSLIKRDFAPAEQRMRSMVARQRSMPQALKEAQRNLVAPVRIYTEIALEQLDGNIDFFRSAVVEAFAGVGDPALRAEFKRTNDAVIEALEQYRDWLRKDVLTRSGAGFAIGPELYRQLLSADEMVDLPLARLLDIAETDLRRNQAALVATARRMDAARDPRAVLESLQQDHPAPEALLATTQSELDALAHFLTGHAIVTIPRAEPARVVETPPFMRSTTSAAMDTPGPFEKTAMPGHYFMTLPDPDWSAAQKEDFMRQWYRALITNVSVHEVWPGHYLQFLYSPQYPGEVRKVFYSSANAEGWAHYCEEMVIDEGFRAGDDAYRLAQLQDALLRDARFVVGIRMHTQGMTVGEAKAYFEREGYQPGPVAESEAKRGTSDPLYGYYTLGKLAIFKLRDDYRAQRGASFSLREFHDTFLRLGPLPLPLVREAMLGERGALL